MINTFLLGSGAFIFFHFFVIYSFMGWCIETIYASIHKKEFVNRGFLHGPFCPIYGFGTLAIIVLLKPIEFNYTLLFLGSIILTSAIEYITGYILETAFNSTWWDYSDKPYNLQGRICLYFSVIWGFISIFILKVIHPHTIYIVNLIPTKISSMLFYVMLLYFFIDFVLAVATVFRLRSLITQLNAAYLELTDKLSEFKLNLSHIKNISELKAKLEQLLGTAEIKMSKRRSDIEHMIKQLKIKYDSMDIKKYPNYSRLIKAFPDLRFKDSNSTSKDSKNRTNKDKKT